MSSALRTVVLFTLLAGASGTLAGGCFFTIGELRPTVDGGAGDGGVDSALVDVAADSGAPCDPAAPFRSITPIESLNSFENDEIWPRLTPDEQTVVLGTQRTPDPFGIYLSTRPDPRADFSAPIYVAPVNAPPAFDADPMLSADGMRLFLQSDRTGSKDLFVAERSSPMGSFGPARPIDTLNTPADEIQPFLSADGTSLWFARTVDGRSQIFRADVAGAAFGPAAAVSELASLQDDWLPVLSHDGLVLYFASKRSGGLGDFDIWVTQRENATAAFDLPRAVTDLNTVSLDAPGYLSVDRCRLYFHSGRNGARLDVFVAEKPAPGG